jgi:hypothetical protein
VTRPLVFCRCVNTVVGVVVVVDDDDVAEDELLLVVCDNDWFHPELGIFECL